MDMSNSNDANITSPFEGISKYSMEQIIKCIDHYLETRVDTFITGHTSKDFPLDRYQWEVEENGVTGRIWVRLDEKDKTKKNIGYGLSKGVKKQDNTVQLATIFFGCMHACLNLSQTAPDKDSDTEPIVEDSVPDEVVDLWKDIMALLRREIEVIFSLKSMSLRTRLFRVGVAVVTGYLLWDSDWFGVLVLAVLSLGCIMHMVHRSKTRVWTKSWGLWKYFPPDRKNEETS